MRLESYFRCNDDIRHHQLIGAQGIPGLHALQNFEMVSTHHPLLLASDEPTRSCGTRIGFYAVVCNPALGARAFHSCYT